MEKRSSSNGRIAGPLCFGSSFVPPPLEWIARVSPSWPGYTAITNCGTCKALPLLRQKRSGQGDCSMPAPLLCRPVPMLLLLPVATTFRGQRQQGVGPTRIASTRGWPCKLGCYFLFAGFVFQAKIQELAGFLRIPQDSFFFRTNFFTGTFFLPKVIHILHIFLHRPHS